MQRAFIERNSSLLEDEKKLVTELEKRNIEIVYFSQKQLLRNKIKLENPYIVSAGLPSMRYIFSHFGISMPISNSYPKELEALYGRDIQEDTIGNAFRRYKNNEDFFIKPRDDFKSFTGFVISENEYMLGKMVRKLKPEYPVLTSTLVDIKSEHRAYIANNAILETSYYFGDDSKLDMDVVNKTVKILSETDYIPSAYAIDFAVIGNGKTVVLELNEGFSIDSYNCSSKNYFNVIKTRWDSFIK